MSRALPTGRLAAYGLLGLPLAMAALPLYVHVPRFYAQALGVPLALVGLVLLASRALDAVQDPFLGWWSDRHQARGGSRWAFVLAGMPLLAGGMAALFMPPRWQGAALVAWLAASLVVVHLAYSLVTVSYQAHGAAIAREPLERTRVVAWREGFALLGVFAGASLPEWLRQAEGERAGFAAFAALFAPLALLAAFAAWRGSPPSLSRPAPARPAGEALLLPLRNRAFRRLLGIFMVNGIAAAIPATLVLFFVADVVRAPALAPAFLVAYFAAGALGLPGWVALARRVGKVAAWAAGMALSIAAFVGAWLLGAGDVAAFFAICVASGLALGADLALPASLLADAIDHDEAAGRGRHEGAYFGLWNLATKLNLAIAAGAALPLLDALGYQPGTAGGHGLAALAAVYALLPCALKALALAALIRFDPTQGDAP